MAFAVTFVLPAFVTMPVLWYQPVEHAWIYDVRAPGIAMDFYGRCLDASIASTLLGGAAHAICRRFIRPEPSGSTVALLTTWALTFTILVMTFFAWRLIHRAPVPPPTPDWYQPR